MSDGVFAFIDAENVRNVFEDYGFKDIDYLKLLKLLEEKGVTRTFIYAGIEDGDTEKKNKFEELSKIKNVYVSVKDVMVYKQNSWDLKNICPKCKFEFIRKIYRKDKKKANCDTELTLDIIRFGVRKKYKKIIVFSADGDFGKVYEYVKKDLRRDVVVYAPSDFTTARKLKEMNKDGTILLEDLKGLFEHYSVS